MMRQNLGVQGVGGVTGRNFSLLPPYALTPSCPRLARGTLYKSLYILLSLCRGLGELPLSPLVFKLLPPPTPVSSSFAACYPISSRRIPLVPKALPGRPGVFLPGPWPAGEPGSWELDPNLWFCLLSLGYLIRRMGTVGLEVQGRLRKRHNKTQSLP